MTEHDRRQTFKPSPRPAWMQTLNAIGNGLDIRSIVPLTPESLLQQARANTGLEDLGGDNWQEPFSILMNSADNEADLHLGGRLLMRTELLIYLEARLQLIEAFKRSPELNAEVVDAPVFITGYGRSGTTILLEVMAQDPQFRVAQKWESLFPVPAPEEATYDADPRIEKTNHVNKLIEEITPEFAGLHKMGGNLPIESLEFEYVSFVSEIFPMIIQVPSYSAYLRTQDLSVAFEWQKKFLQLLQSKYKASHWLMKSPSHLLHLQKYLRVFPGMRLIFAHRDPIVSADSVVSFMGTLFWQRTDNIWREQNDLEVLSMAEQRAKAWDDVIAMIEDGRLAKGMYANFYYDQFVRDPIAAIASVYDQLGMTLTPAAADKMRAYLANKFKGKHGAHLYEQAPVNAVESERPLYQRYQTFFNVPNEI
ncbi:MAG: hypothetical protein JWM78_3690 [Verrucomicrobiaceae bacterium]|nr:hypothetical protein [Verrucomicrobiaceae bacterium]